MLEFHTGWYGVGLCLRHGWWIQASNNTPTQTKVRAPSEMPRPGIEQRDTAVRISQWQLIFLVYVPLAPASENIKRNEFSSIQRPFQPHSLSVSSTSLNLPTFISIKGNDESLNLLLKAHATHECVACVLSNPQFTYVNSDIPLKFVLRKSAQFVYEIHSTISIICRN